MNEERAGLFHCEAALWSSVKDNDDQGRFLRTERTEMSLVSSR